jgi:hypothetical protein
MPKLPKQSGAVYEKLLFVTRCVAEVFPGAKEDRVPKAGIFDAAASWGFEQEDCPAVFSDVRKLRRYIGNHWPTIRLMLPEEYGILPCYVDGAEFTGGGGYRQGNVKLARKQVDIDARVVDGVVESANAFAEATVAMFPQIEARRASLTNRLITKSH